MRFADCHCDADSLCMLTAAMTLVSSLRVWAIDLLMPVAKLTELE